jgi:hypothetical protein
LTYAPTLREFTKLKPGSTGRHEVSSLSPNGKWIACAGFGEGIYVLPFPGIGKRLQISHGDAAQPVWSRDGQHLFFIAPDKTLMAVPFEPENGNAGTPQAVFKTRIVAKNFAGTQYDVSPDGSFLIHSLPADYAAPLTLLYDAKGKQIRPYIQILGPHLFRRHVSTRSQGAAGTGQVLWVHVLSGKCWFVARSVSR